MTAADRIRGSLLGLAVGDALGAPLEGSSPQTAARAVEAGLEMTGGGVWAPGEWTDDTALALCLAESIAACGLLDTDDVASRYIAWARTGKGMGSTTRAALVGATGADDARARARAFGDSPSNGTVMRAAPIGLAARSVDEATRAAREDALLTHHAPAAGDASAALCAALVALRRGEAPDLRLAGDPNAGMCWTTLRIALDALAAGDYESGIVSVIGRGGDTDTNAAVAGALLGCRDGPDAIPARWLAALRDRERVERAAKSVASSPRLPSAARRAGPGSSG